jgi:hypothetical protein
VPIDRLARAAGFGTLQVTTPDEGSQVFVDGHFQGQGRVVTLRQLAAGPHRVHVVVGTRKSRPKDIELKPGARLAIDF